jgi:ABC-2 type transport system permease protein
VALALSIGIGQFGELLALPDWVRWLSPFSHAAAAPVERVNLGEALLLTAAAIGGTGMAALAARRRDLVAG